MSGKLLFLTHLEKLNKKSGLQEAEWKEGMRGVVTAEQRHREKI